MTANWSIVNRGGLEELSGADNEESHAPAKVSSKPELWLEEAGIGWSEVEVSTK